MRVSTTFDRNLLSDIVKVSMAEFFESRTHIIKLRTSIGSKKLATCRLVIVFFFC